MSFTRVGRLQHGQGKRPAVRPKKANAPKREWVSTVHDLSVHKASPEELNRRHEMHRSQNRVVAQWELRERALRHRRKKDLPGSPAPLDRASLNIIREVFSDQFQLQDVLARSDRAMAVVKDLFGDAPRRQTGFPSVTMAPDCGSDSDLPVLQKPEAPTQLSLLSQSMMDPQALNELEDSVEDHSDEETGHSASVNFNSNMDTSYKVYTRKVKAKPCTRGGKQQRPQCNSNLQGAGGDSPPQTPSASGGTQVQTALNATVKVQRLWSRQPQPQPEPGEHFTLVTQVLNPDPPLTRSGRKSRSSKASRGRSTESGLDGSTLSSLSGNQSSLGLLQGLLGQVETELDGLGLEEPPRAPGAGEGEGTTGPKHSTHGLTGFSVALVSTLGRLARLLRQREDEAQREGKERRRLEVEVKEQRGMIDALTAETLTLREESAALQARLQQRACDLEQRLDTVVLVLGGLGVLGGDGDYEPQEAGSIATGSEWEPSYDADAPVPSYEQNQTGLTLNPAVLLSPPHQRDNRPHGHTSGVHSLAFHHVPSLPVTRGSCDDLQTFSSAPSLFSLPRPAPTPPPAATPDPLPLLCDPSQGAMLSQIAELTRQNALIRDQLGQFHPATPPSGSEICEGQSSGRGSVSSSTGRLTPQQGMEKRGFVPSSTGRTTPQREAGRERGIWSCGGEQRTQQSVVREGPGCESSVEQRLLELNRQSAAARSRLLELIEQQRQSSSSARVSPSVSPIPPLSAAGLSPESSILLPEQDPSPLGSGGSRRSAGGVSPQSLGGQPRGSRTPVDKLKGEGWFALSTHVR
ncbi:spindle and centriole-associated protein 1 isoform X1 [Oncorhynchus kisutch]|uniref:spindle and centriole-associated protein 1 isoform X1 n=1 Tax=Oncorhynchus kisutch TaxID=8019 RepID=UPI0009A067A6|nr:spindle and centriole-associated protein 1 isoform X1 [Oncorhynchus kisutch]